MCGFQLESSNSNPPEEGFVLRTLDCRPPIIGRLLKKLKVSRNFDAVTVNWNPLESPGIHSPESPFIRLTFEFRCTVKVEVRRIPFVQLNWLNSGLKSIGSRQVPKEEIELWSSEIIWNVWHVLRTEITIKGGERVNLSKHSDSGSPARFVCLSVRAEGR